MQKMMTIKLCVVAVLLSACSQRTVDPEATPSNTGNISDTTQIGEEVNKVSGDTVAIDESSYGNENENEDASKNAGTQTAGKYNSSGKGFQSIYFPFGAYGIAGDMQEYVSSNTQSVKKASGRIKIAGNCDEFGTDEYNYALGLKRAKAVRDAMTAQGADTSKMTIISYGESNPACANATDACYSQNRRVDIFVVH